MWVLVFYPRTVKDNDAQETPLHRVERVWASWKDLDVSPLEASESLDKGLRKESIECVPGLKKAVYGLAA